MNNKAPSVKGNNMASWRIIIFCTDPTSGEKLVDKVGVFSTRKKCSDWANKRKVKVRNNPMVEIKEIQED